MSRSACLLAAVGAAAGARVQEYAQYETSEGTSQGVISYNDDLCTATNKCPGVMIVPDWTGVDAYEIGRACLLADLGYVAFVADVYGLNRTGSWPGQADSSHWGAAATAHWEDPVLYMEKMQKGMEKMLAYNFVDYTKVAAMGYCFGASGVINLVMRGHQGWTTPLLGVVGYHASSTGLSTVQTAVPSAPKLLLYQGLRDGAFDYAARTSLEAEMERGSRTYQLSIMGAGVGHGYTVETAGAFDPIADKRSWDGTLRFFQELFEPGMATPQADPGEPATPGQDVAYTADGVEALGYMVADPTRCNATSRCPAVVVIQDWNGLTDYEKRRTELVAAMGYVAFAADIYGVNTPKANVMDWAAAAGMHNNNGTKYMRKIYDAFQTVIDMPHVDPTKIAAIGYCFGGTGVISLGIIGDNHTTHTGVPPGATLLGVVGYHAGFSASTARDLQQGAGGRRPKVLVMSGAMDGSNAGEDMYVLEEALDNASTTYEVQRYGPNVQHSFTDWDANMAPGNVYNPLADLRSWESTKRFFHEIFSGENFRGPATVGICAVDIDLRSSAGAMTVPLLLAAFLALLQIALSSV